jgi:hypothetical protein
MVAGKEASTSDVRATERLRRYWTIGPGAVKINWGAPGDFNRCVAELSRHVTDPQGLCATYHHDALGIWPVTHAKQHRERRRGA